jgi:DNA-binding transcriptional LysR family regulator
MTNLAEMAAFVAVVEHKSFSKAGRELRVSTAVMSARIAKLEQSLGVRLLNRTTRQVIPTEEALLYFEDCKNILKQVELAEATLSSRRHKPSGTLKITAPVVFGRRYLGPLLPEFQKRFPDLQLRLTLTDEFVDLLGEGVDLAVRIAALPDSSMMARQLAKSPRLLCASPEYIAVNGTPENPTELLDHNCLLLRFSGSTQFQWSFGDRVGRQTIAVKGTLDSNNGDIIRGWAIAGQGICLKSRWEVADDLDKGRLIEIMPQHPPRAVTISALYPQGNIVPPKVRVVLDYLVEAFQEIPEFSVSAAGG